MWDPLQAWEQAGVALLPLTFASGTTSWHHNTHDPLLDSLRIPTAPCTSPMPL